MDISTVNFIADLKTKKMPAVLEFIEQDEFYNTYLVSDNIGLEAVIKLCRELDPKVRKVAVSSNAGADLILSQAEPYAIETADRAVVGRHHTNSSLLFFIPPLQSEIEHRWFKNQSPRNICMDSTQDIRRDRRAITLEPSSFNLQLAVLNGYRFIQTTGLEKENKELVHFRTWLKKNKKEIETIKFK